MIPKFRAWYSNEMWLVAKFDLWGEPYQTTCDLAPLLPNTNELYDVPLTDVALMQLTGLKDKNGKDIYEGDIVLWFDSDGNGRINCVFFSDGAFKICNSKYTLSDYLMNRLQVIGNIYENPELVEK